MVRAEQPVGNQTARRRVAGKTPSAAVGVRLAGRVSGGQRDRESSATWRVLGKGAKQSEGLRVVRPAPRDGVSAYEVINSGTRL